MTTDPFKEAIERGRRREPKRYLDRIDDAIDSYADHAGSGDGDSAPYDSASLAEIYAPRARQLLDLQAQGFTYAEWKSGDWHGLTDDEYMEAVK